MGTPKIAVVGRGPSAAYAWRACLDAGYTPDVYGPAPTLGYDRPHGAFYLHALPESVAAEVEPRPIRYEGIGTAEGYVRKIWGRSDVASSFPTEPRTEWGYAPEPGLAALWGTRHRERLHDELCSETRIRALCEEHDLVVLTFAFRLPQRLRERLRWMTLFYQRRGMRSHPMAPRYSLLYNGHEDVAWVRRSHLDGETALEYPGLVDEFDLTAPLGRWERQVWPDLPPAEDAEFWAAVQQHLRDDARQWPEQLFRVGRYGTWQRKALSHESYTLVSERLFNQFGTASGSLTWPSPLETAAL